MFADRFYQVRQWKRSRFARAQQLPDGLTHCRFFEFFLRVSREVAKGSALGGAVQQLLFVKPIEGCHHRCVSELDAAGIEHLANRGASPCPQRGKQFLLQGSEPRAWRPSQQTKNPFHTHSPGSLKFLFIAPAKRNRRSQRRSAVPSRGSRYPRNSQIARREKPRPSAAREGVSGTGDKRYGLLSELNGYP